MYQAYYQPDRSFLRCGATGVDTENNIIWAYVTPEEAGYGTETPFAPGGELSPPTEEEPGKSGEPVGGDVYPVNKVNLLIPWIALGAAITAAGILLFRRRALRSK